MIKETIIRGFEIWKGNLQLGLPYLIESIATALIFLITVFAVFYVTPVMHEVNEIQEVLKGDAKLTKEERLKVTMEKYEKVKEVIFKILAKLDKKVNVLIGIAIINFLFTFAITSFFRCIEIEYCLNAIKSNRNLKEAFFKSKGKWFSVYTFYLLMYGLIFIISGIVFLFIVFPHYKGLNFFEYTRGEIISLMAYFTIFIFIFVAIAATISFFLFFGPYAIVIDDLPVLNSIRESVSLVKNNFWTVVIFWLVSMIPVFVVSLVVIPIKFFTTGIAGTIVYNAVLILLIAFFARPTITLWWILVYQTTKQL